MGGNIRCRRWSLRLLRVKGYCVVACAISRKAEGPHSFLLKHSRPWPKSTLSSETAEGNATVQMTGGSASERKLTLDNTFGFEDYVARREPIRWNSGHCDELAWHMVAAHEGRSHS